MFKQLGIASLFSCSLICSMPAQAAVSAEQADRLGKDLTPIGATKAGSEDGRVPEFTGGLPKKDIKRGANPFSADKPLFTITSENYQQYADELTEGHKALFKTFPKSYKMNVYPTQRSASFPDYVYEATKKNATDVSLNDRQSGFCCTASGFPFPITENGREMIFNHKMRYIAKGFKGHINAAVTGTDGDYVVERSYFELAFHYNHPKTTVENLENQRLWLLSKVVEPTHKAGDSYLIHVPIDRIAEKANVWIFNPGLGRIRRIGKVGYDNPEHDGLVVHDQLDMFNGPVDRYTVKLIGKKEMIMPYNAYSMYSPEHKYKDIITKGHINQDIPRYEVHRMWVLEMNVKEGQNHQYKKRVMYIDEDSWLILAQDIYDERDDFWRFAEAFPINYTKVPVFMNPVQVHYDIQSRRYVILNIANEEKKEVEYDWHAPKKYFTTKTLKKFARRNQR